ncbi:MAG: hypothetical protein J6D37_00700 [Clostridia bacterium]|nr:hypothetical protein [Clostridia bacterium]
MKKIPVKYFSLTLPFFYLVSVILFPILFSYQVDFGNWLGFIYYIGVFSVCLLGALLAIRAKSVSLLLFGWVMASYIALRGAVINATDNLYFLIMEGWLPNKIEQILPYFGICFVLPFLVLLTLFLVHTLREPRTKIDGKAFLSLLPAVLSLVLLIWGAWVDANLFETEPKHSYGILFRTVANYGLFCLLGGIVLLFSRSAEVRKTSERILFVVGGLNTYLAVLTFQFQRTEVLTLGSGAFYAAAFLCLVPIIFIGIRIFFKKQPT